MLEGVGSGGGEGGLDVEGRCGESSGGVDGRSFFISHPLLPSVNFSFRRLFARILALIDLCLRSFGGGGVGGVGGVAGGLEVAVAVGVGGDGVGGGVVCVPVVALEGGPVGGLDLVEGLKVDVEAVLIVSGAQTLGAVCNARDWGLTEAGSLVSSRRS